MSTKPPYFAMAIALGLWLATTAPAAAYIGPGAGITMLGALWGVIMAVVIALGAVVWWPVRALRRKITRRRADPSVGTEANTGAKP
jgi:hypothetical protein